MLGSMTPALRVVPNAFRVVGVPAVKAGENAVLRVPVQVALRVPVHVVPRFQFTLFAL